jgi:hypothetical protein
MVQWDFLHGIETQIKGSKLKGPGETSHLVRFAFQTYLIEMKYTIG